MKDPLENFYLEGEEDYYKLPKHEVERRKVVVSNWMKEVGIKNA